MNELKCKTCGEDTGYRLIPLVFKTGKCQHCGGAFRVIWERSETAGEVATLKMKWGKDAAPLAPFSREA